MKSGIELIKEERNEQIKKHGRTIEKDVTVNQYHQLADAAAHLCKRKLQDDILSITQSLPVSWSRDKWKSIIQKPYKERLVIAGALIAAEIDRLNRLDKN